MRYLHGELIFSPSDLVQYVTSPFASWMARYHLEHPTAATPDQETEEERLIAQTGNQHEQDILVELKQSHSGLIEIPRDHTESAIAKTLSSMSDEASVIYQAALKGERFMGFADFLILDEFGQYEVWDTKLARSPKSYYAIQLCCYSEMLAASTTGKVPEKFGIILGTGERVKFRVEDFIHYYRRVKKNFLALQDRFTGKLTDRPEPFPRADHGRWTSYADKCFDDADHLVKVAGITVGQIRKLNAAGISTLEELARSKGRSIPKLAATTFETLVAQARLQSQTRADRRSDPEALARYESLPQKSSYEPAGLAALPLEHTADVFFDMEGYPLVPGGLEYLFGACSMDETGDHLDYFDWWGHDRAEEKRAFEGFVDWVFQRWCDNPGMHIYHYAAYEISAIRRLSTQHDSRQDAVDELLRNEVFVDLYQVVRQGIRIGEDSYSIKKVERLYREQRSTQVATAAESIVKYARWMSSKESRLWMESAILGQIREYNKDDCYSTAELSRWLRRIAAEDIDISELSIAAAAAPRQQKDLPSNVVARLEIAARLREQGDAVSVILADLIDFHRREEKPMWWRMFDRAKSNPEELRDDPGCIEGVRAVGLPRSEKQSLIQSYSFDPAQECKRASGDKVMFTHDLMMKFNLQELDVVHGRLALKISKKSLNEKCGGVFPAHGSILPDEHVPASSIQIALSEVAQKHLDGHIHASAKSLLERIPPRSIVEYPGENRTDAAIRITATMSGECLVIQGPPGTGKTYTASRVIRALLKAGKRVGVASNSHKAVVNLLVACGEAVREYGGALQGVKAGGDDEGQLFTENLGFQHVENNPDARAIYSNGIIGGTAWLFTRPEWEEALDFLFIDEAGQVSLANTIAMSRCATNLVLLGDQMQLEQPVQGAHPGDSGLSGLQYALKDLDASRPDLPVFHPVVPKQYGLFLGESRRMHPSVCRFISESIYDGMLKSHPLCERQSISLPNGIRGSISIEHGIAFFGVEHEGNIQQSNEEIEKIQVIYSDLLGRPYTASDGTKRALTLEDFLFIAPYNAQVRALQAALPPAARVGSIDGFQGQQAPVCILSLCSSYGEYGSRGLSFILDRNRINVAISRAQCLAVVVADPRIASTAAGSLDEMTLLNLFCKISEEPTETTAL
jgi:predicted RecB family nuclease